MDSEHSGELIYKCKITECEKQWEQEVFLAILSRL